MKQSQLFTKTRREAPAEEEALNAKVLIRAGFIHKEMAGVYDILPLGLRTLEKINSVIRQEMNALGANEILMSALQNPELWKSTKRWDDEAVDIWFKTQLKNGGELGLGFTHEEPITNMLTAHISSYRDLPKSVYQIQTKFRNETRSKSGLLRGREFLMKDLYSFVVDESAHAVFYEKTKRAYLNIFSRLGLGEKTYLTFASGGSFSKYSHEFQTVLPGGEDTVHICDRCRVAVNKEIIADQGVCPDCGGALDREEKAVEVGNIFTLGTKFSEGIGLYFIDETGEKKPVFMGSYGIGPTRCMATVVELLAKSENEMVWPKNIAPFAVHIVEISGKGNGDIKKAGEELYLSLRERGVEVLYDDRELTAGEKFADADLIGIPVRIIVGKSFAEKGTLEVIDRTTDQKSHIELRDVEKIFEILQN